MSDINNIITRLTVLVNQDKSSSPTYSKSLLAALIQDDIKKAKEIGARWISSLKIMSNDMKMGFPQTNSAKTICSLVEEIDKL
ncbi:MAG: hypothetical protein PF569_08135 [Candidatus Woesearchaeota archaeon]|jgi:hypothetical protein|nr:hypothetical protein [Candidatus Woesearchaeota archaeon]